MMKPCLLLLVFASCAPAWPDGAALTVAEATGTSVELTWPPAIHSDGIDAYRVFRGEEILAAALAGNATRFVAGGLTDGTTYRFSVQARIESGGWSKPLHLEVVTPDTTPPQWEEPPRFSVAVEAESELHARLALTWGDVEDNVGIHQIVIHHAREEPILVAGDARQYVLESPIPDGIWQIEAKDTAGNASEMLAFNVETELAPVRSERLKERAREMLATRGKAGKPDMFGPKAVGRPVEESTTSRGSKGPVWLGEGGREECRTWVTSRLPMIERCYAEARHQDAALAGALTITLVVNAAGEISASRMDGIKHASLRSCIRQTLRGRSPKKPTAVFRTEVIVHMVANDRE